MNGSVCFLEALEAPVIPTFADDIGWLHRWVLHSVDTVWGRTPLSYLVDVNEGLLEIVLIL